MFSISGDPKWLSVFHPSHTEMVHKKASIATNIFLQTFSLQGEKKKKKQKESKEPFYMLIHLLIYFLKVVKGRIAVPVGKDCLRVPMPVYVCRLVFKS